MKKQAPSSSRPKDQAKTRGAKRGTAPVAAVSDLEAGAPVIGIGASAGGLSALSQLLACMSVKCGAAFVIAQHLDPHHKTLLGELLGRKCRFPVTPLGARVRPQADHVYFVPPGRSCKLSGGLLRTGPLRRSGRHPSLVDDFFVSLATALGKRSVGVLLSGSGHDGVAGLKAIQAAGGSTLCQSPRGAEVSGMPEAAVHAAAADLVLDIPALADELVRMARALAHVPDETPDVPAVEADDLAGVLAALRSRTGLDFSTYKPSTVRRRLARRMTMGKFDSLTRYVRQLEESAAEASHLAEDLLIHVTRFFRDPATFSVLKRSVLHRLMSQRGAHQPLRIWVPGCATGEEVYSLAITVLEYVEDKAIKPQIQIFGTDISEQAVTKARAGVYPAKRARAEVPAELLPKYFSKVDGGYQVSHRVRALCAFARHDVALDPPFSRLDIISCRNVLIYHTNEAQQRSLSMFHYALLPHGVLILGASESTGARPDLFSALSGRQRIFLKKSAGTRQAFRMSSNEAPGVGPRAAAGTSETVSPEQLACKEADRLLLTRFSPAAVLVGPDLQILQFRGKPASYLRPASGAASLSILKMVDPALAPPLHRALRKVEGTIKASSMVITLEGEAQALDVRIEVVPIHVAQAEAQHALIVFQATPAIPANGKMAPGEVGPTVERLRSELAAVRDHLQTLIAEHELASNALQAALEAGQSSNEELQSTNEELETAKEELQSTNEELSTVNDELSARNLELNQLNGDLVHVLASIEMPVLTLGRDARIRRFNQAAERALHLLPGDVGRALSDVRTGLPDEDLTRLVTRAIRRKDPGQAEVVSHDGQAYLLRVRAYPSASAVVDGVILTLAPIQGEAERAAEEERSRRARVGGEVRPSRRASTGSRKKPTA